MLPIAELVFVRDRIHDRIQTVYIGPDSRRLFLDTRINLRNGLDLWVHRFGSLIDFANKVSDRLNSEIHPLSEICIGEVAWLHILSRVQAGGAFEGRNGVIVKAGPGVFPTIKMRSEERR